MEGLFHLIVPTLIALAVGFDRKKVLTLALLSILPDIDHALVYRALFHNVFFLVLVVAAVYAVKKDREMAVLAAFFIGSHLLFDLGGGIAMFYPIDDHYYSLKAAVVGKAGVVPTRLELALTRVGNTEWNALLYERLSKVERVWVSTEIVMVVVALILAAVLFVYVYRQKKKPQ